MPAAVGAQLEIGYRFGHIDKKSNIDAKELWTFLWGMKSFYKKISKENEKKDLPI